VTEPETNELQMSFWEHLDELRGRLIKALVAFAIGAIAAWTYKAKLLAWITRPFVEGWKDSLSGSTPSLHFSEPQALFFAYMKLSLLGGFVFALPIILYQVWAFIAPGLYARERRFAVPFVLSSTGLFALGGYYGWKVAYPIAFQYFLSLAGTVETGGLPLEVRPTVMIDSYIEFVVRMSVGLGAVFELPVLVFFLSVAGLVSHRELIKFWRYFIVLAFLIGAVLTPPDWMSQFLVAVPLCVLYAISIGIAKVFSRKAAPTTEEPARPSLDAG
jgi:sec-independent protein translocase protein TatC